MFEDWCDPDFDSKEEMLEALESIMLEEKFGVNFDHKIWSFLQNDN